MHLFRVFLHTHKRFDEFIHCVRTTSAPGIIAGLIKDPFSIVAVFPPKLNPPPTRVTKWWRLLWIHAAVPAVLYLHLETKEEMKQESSF